MTGILAAVASSASGQGNLDATPATVSDSVATPTTALAYLSFENDGDITTLDSGGSTNIGDWLVAGAAAAFDINVTVNSGALQVGAAGTFNLGTTRQFGCDKAIVGTSTANVTFKLRRAGSSTDLDTATVAFSAEVTV